MKSTRLGLVLGTGLALVATGCSHRSGPASTIPKTAPTSRAAAADVSTGQAAVPSTGCSQPAGPELSGQKETIEVGGTSRFYLLSTPPPPAGSTAIPRPVVVDFHGLDEGAGVHEATSLFGPLGQKDGFVAVYPNGTGTPVHWDTAPSPSNPDLVYVNAMLDQLESTLCLDTSRIYATGFSDGAIMTSTLACTMADRFAAFAPVSGITLPSPCPLSRKIPILTFHGTADPVLYFNGGYNSKALGPLFNHSAPDSGAPTTSSTTTTTLPPNLNGAGIPATVATWAKLQDCQPKPTDVQLTPHVIHRTYPCPAGAAVEFDIVEGAGHAWPGSTFSQKIAAVTGPTTFEIDGSAVIWAFFQGYRLPS